MTPLRQQMIDAMQQRGFSERTHQSYLASVRSLAGYFHKPPDQLHILAEHEHQFWSIVNTDSGLT